MDHCTWFPDGWWGEKCCAPHDADYLAQVDRALADDTLFWCVATAADHPVLAAIGLVVAGIMWMGVRAFGSRYFPK